MGEASKIEWTDATVNFWWGCTKVGPGCDHCYAESFDKRVGGAHWGIGTPRRQIASAANTLAKLNRQGGKRVFIQSMSDLFDNEVTPDWFNQAWMHIHMAKDCRIQIVTKRVSNVEKIIARSGFPTWPTHAGLMITVVNQAEGDRDIPRLLALKAKLGIPWVGLSMEPLLGLVDLINLQPNGMITVDALGGRTLSREGDYDESEPRLDWVIVGGESGPKARPMHPDWARSLRDQCQAAGVPFFFKQWGEWGTGSQLMSTREPVFRVFRDFQHWVNKASTWVRGGICLDAMGRRCEIGADLMRARDEETFPVTIMDRVGKARAGRLLDGREWNDMPGALIDG